MSLLDDLKKKMAEQIAAWNPEVALAADVEVETDVLRTGTFKDMKGQIVRVTKEILHELAASLNLETFRPKVKKGHVKVGPTDEPALGEVVGLRVDGDKLYAKLAMSKDLAEDVRNRKFTERSSEYDDTPGKRKFLGLALLGARSPAVDGLSPLVLQAGEVPEGLVVMLAEAAPVPEKTAPPLDDAARLKEEPNRKEPQMADDKALADEKAARESAEAQAKDAIAKLQAHVAEDVDRFLESDTAKKKIPLTLLKNPGLKNFLVALAGLEGISAALPEKSRIVAFAAPDGKSTVDKSLYGAAKAILSSLTDKLSEADERQTATDDKAVKLQGAEMLPAVAPFLERDEESDQVALQVRQLQASEKAAGRELSYEDAVRVICTGN